MEESNDYGGCFWTALLIGIIGLLGFIITVGSIP